MKTVIKNGLEWTNAPWYDDNKNIIGIIIQTGRCYP